MVQKRDEHKEPVIRAFVALPGETLVEAAARLLPGSGLFVSRAGKEIATNNMNDDHPSQEDHLGFLQQYKTESEIFSLSSGEQVSIQKYFLHFDLWRGAKPEFDFGQKPILAFEGKACFAELAILRMFLKHGWDGAWVETYGGVHFLRSMPNTWSLKSEHIQIPADKEDLLKRIWKAGDTRACFDVLVWSGADIFFCEAKRLKKDRLNEAQKKFIQGALACGISPSQFLIAEWDLL
ncbi:hypothetical protein A3B01_01525 [Candidatus Nomurabacteria bacterium RIFCSPLOWO2_01_FULL_41_52b]|nr:MAG: hypothetical protein A3B97_04380 [Candidatus Giovannonibacteria bacterium RIFCSPHIGHO2_02_FULL_43_32]OGI90236.1 MAG: hypothetical protein A3B01_01525 [Candidatus Nomurabacteria bacterium RIFCSPLOWO2_01_FULL_41_52b]